MSTKAEEAKKLFEKGYNCSQAVIGAFCEDVGLDFKTAIKISSSFGGGMGGLREVCGAVTGAFMILGLKFGYTSPKDPVSKKEHYALIQKFAQKFQESTGSIVCRELLGLDKGNKPLPSPRTPEYYKNRPCGDIVAISAKILDDMIKENL